jgi:hypothetical protein
MSDDGTPKRRSSHSKRTGRPTGRPAHAPSDQLRDIVERMARIGLSHDAIGFVLGLGSRHTVRKHYRQQLDRGATAIHLAFGQVYAAKMLGGTGVPGDE